MLSGFRGQSPAGTIAKAFHGKHFRNLLTERPLLRSAGPAWKASWGLPELAQQNDMAIVADLIVAFKRSTQHECSVLEGAAFPRVRPAALQNGRSADSDQREKQFRHRGSRRHGAARAAGKVLAQVGPVAGDLGALCHDDPSKPQSLQERLEETRLFECRLDQSERDSGHNADRNRRETRTRPDVHVRLAQIWDDRKAVADMSRDLIGRACARHVEAAIRFEDEPAVAR